jgi:hypothetical protein
MFIPKSTQEAIDWLKRYDPERLCKYDFLLKQEQANMAYEQRNNSGILFKNERRDRDTSPDYRGTITIEGVQFWMSAWIREGKKGKFLKLSVQLKEKPVMDESAFGQKGQNGHLDDFDEVPF